MQSGHKLVPFLGAEQEDQKKSFEGYKDGLVRLTPGNWVLLPTFPLIADRMYNFELRPSDVVVVTFPKCGTTWMQEIVWTMRNNANIDNPMAEIGINMRCPFMELDQIVPPEMVAEMGPNSDLIQAFSKMCPGKDPKHGVFHELAAVSPDPRTMKTHLSLSLMPPKMLDTCKIVYVARNPKDVCVSYFHHCRIMRSQGYLGELPQFVDYFVNDQLLYSPYGPHLKEAWEKRGHENLHFVFFEEMKADPEKEIRKLNDFLGTNLTDKQISNVIDYTSFKSMKKRDNLIGGDGAEALVNLELVKTMGGFFRKGETGSFKDKLSPTDEAKIDDWTKNNMEGIPFKY